MKHSMWMTQHNNYSKYSENVTQIERCAL